jgi:hypothetical protein
MSGGDNDVSRLMSWYDNGGAKPCKGVGYLFCIGGPCPYAVASVMAKGRAKVPTFDRVRNPCLSYVGFLRNENFCAGERGVVEIKGAMHVGLGG